jgi:hypothetical protein
MEKESSLTPEESLRIITEMINKTKEEYGNNSFYFLLWGYLISMACLLQFSVIKILLNMGQHSYIGIASAVLWGIIVSTGFIIQYKHIEKTKNQVKIITHIGEFLTIHWQVNGALIIIAGLFCWKYHIHPTPFILAICGAATMITGMLIRQRSLLMGSLFMLGFAIIALWIDNEYQLIINAVAIIFGYVLPGYSLKSLNK